MICIRGDHESNCGHNCRARKEEIALKFKLEDSKLDGYSDSSVFSD